MSIGHQFSDLIKGCTFHGIDCLNSSVFKNYPSPAYGNCFTFNKENATQDELAGLRKSSLPGPKFGLSFVLNIDPENYLGVGRTEQSGARITLHKPSTFPTVADSGIDVPTNVLTNIAIEKKTVTRKKSPYTSKCDDEWSSTNYTDIVPSDWGYTLKLCQRTCIHSMITQDCGCFHPFYMDHPDWEGDYAPCNLTDSHQNNTCYNAILLDLESERRECSCQVDCDEEDYTATTSAATFPEYKYREIAHQTYGNGKVEKDFIEQMGLNTGHNLLKVNIYYQHLNVLNIAESAEYDTFGLCSSIGGALSLWLGISLAMFFEVVEFIIDIFWSIFRFSSHRQ